MSVWYCNTRPQNHLDLRKIVLNCQEGEAEEQGERMVHIQGTASSFSMMFFDEC